MALIDRTITATPAIRASLRNLVQRLLDWRHNRPARPTRQTLPTSQDIATRVHLQSLGHRR